MTTLNKVWTTLSLAVLCIMSFIPAAFAQVAAAANAHSQNSALAMAAALAISIAAFGGALAQGKAAAAALEGTARNPGAYNNIFTLALLGLALIESLVIYALVIAFLLQGKIG